MNHRFSRSASLLVLIVLSDLLPPPVAAAREVAPPAAVTPHVLSPPFAGWVNSLYTNLENALRDNQRRVVQFCLIGMLLALWIIWWRK